MNRLIVMSALAALSLSSPAYASGGVGGGASADSYARGRAVVGRLLACKKCLYAGGVQDAEQAKEALAKIEAGEIEMSDVQARSASLYLARRFNLEGSESK
jgi:hypothetical protein